MSHVKRWKSGERNERKCAVDSATAIELGDLLWLDDDDVKPASQLSDLGSERLNQIKFRNLFAGVAMEPHAADSGATTIRVATSGIFEFIAASDTYEIGTLIAIDEASSGTELENQTVVDADFQYMAIGQIARREASATTTVRIAIDPPIWRDRIPASSNWLYGDRNEIEFPIDDNQDAAIGDFMLIESDDARRASVQSDQGSEGGNQQLAHDNFIGVAMEAHTSGGGATQLKIATTGVFLFTCPDEDRSQNNLMGIDEAGSGTALENQVVDNVSNTNAAIGVIQHSQASGTTCEVSILATQLHPVGGVQTSM
jgi:hypothetical protein